MDLKEKIKEAILNKTETWFGRRLKTDPLSKYYKIRANDIDALVSELAVLCEWNNDSTSENSLHKHIVSNRRELLIAFSKWYYSSAIYEKDISSEEEVDEFLKSNL